MSLNYYFIYYLQLCTSWQRNSLFSPKILAKIIITAEMKLVCIKVKRKHYRNNIYSDQTKPVLSPIPFHILFILFGSSFWEKEGDFILLLSGILSKFFRLKIKSIETKQTQKSLKSLTFMNGFKRSLVFIINMNLLITK